MIVFDFGNIANAVKSAQYSQFPFHFMKDKMIKENQIAIWSDSSSIVTSLDLLFNIIWHGDKTVEANRYALLEKMQEYRFKIKEIEQENIGLTTLNKLLTNNRN